MSKFNLEIVCTFTYIFKSGFSLNVFGLNKFSSRLFAQKETFLPLRHRIFQLLLRHENNSLMRAIIFYKKVHGEDFSGGRRYSASVVFRERHQGLWLQDWRRWGSHGSDVERQVPGQWWRWRGWRVARKGC